MKQVIVDLYGLFNFREKRRLLVLFFLMFISGGLQMVSVVAVMPFIGVVTNPQLINTNTILSYMYQTIGFNTETQFLIFLGSCVLLLILLSNLFFGISVYMQQRFAQNFQVGLAKQLLELYLRQRYSFFLHQNSTYLSKKIIEDASGVADTLLISILDLLIGSLISLFLISLIVIIDPILALTVLGFIGVFYGVIYKLYYKSTVKLGEQRSVASAARFKVLSEAFNSIKDTKLFGIEGVFVDKFNKNATVFAKANARIRVQVKLPGLALDLIIFGGIMMIVLYVLATKNNLNASLPIITLYGFTAYRLKPQIQTIFNSVSNINFSRASLEVVLSDVKKLSATVEEKQTGVVDKIQFQHLSLEDIVFRYPQAEDFALRGISFKVLSRQSVALVGPSGSGKTTLVDIILGLLEQQQGKVKVNGQEVSVTNRHAWQGRLGYVPQHIYLLDDTILNNIAFGVPANKIDMQKITKALELADLAGFIRTLPAGLNTEIGERGVRLSGGQRQRIGIARALYRDPEVLVLDEATSALDGITEDNIIGSLNKLHGNITLIMIAHRLTTVQNCDCIFMMEGGKLVQEGTYQELLETNLTFKRMAKATSF